MDEKELLEIIEEAARDRRKTLVLSHRKIKSLPAEIRKLKNLEALLLNGNQLTSIPKEIGQLTNLRLLHLNDNQ